MLDDTVDDAADDTADDTVDVIETNIVRATMGIILFLIKRIAIHLRLQQVFNIIQTPM